MRFRNSAKAVIIENNSVLAIEKKDNGEPWYLLPGGGQEFGETLVDALKREVQEELGAEVEIGEMILCREYIGKNHEFASTDSDFHQVEFYFHCELLSPVDLSKATHLDTDQVGVKWISLSSKDESLYPKFLLEALQNISGFKYYGDKN